jgi:YVTN family beta-propeller protein
MRRAHRHLPGICLALLGLTAAGLAADGLGLFQLLRSTVAPGKQPDGSWLVVTEQLVRPWGEATVIPGRPVDMAFDSRRYLLAVLNMSSVIVLDGATGVQTAELKTKTTSYCGIRFRPGDREVWASEATREGPDSIFIGRLTEAGGADGSERIALPGHPVPTGIAFSPDGRKAFVALSRDNAVAVIDVESRRVEAKIPVGMAPFAVLIAPGGDRLYVSNRAGAAPERGAEQAPSSGVMLATDRQTGAILNGTVSVVDLKTLTARNVIVGRAPTGIALSPDGRTLAVANGHSDSITLVDTVSLKTTDVAIRAIPEGVLGSQPVAVAFAPRGDKLYVAAAGINSIVVLDKRKGRYSVSGAIPAGWFPAGVALDRDGDLRVLNIKGVGNTDDRRGGHRSRAYEGSLLRIPAQIDTRLAAATREVRAANSPAFQASAGGVANLPSLGIRHVFLIIKENRTYDQVFGDMSQGNSDPKFLMYGRDITPNHHALAEKYVLLDNFYASGAISFEGHSWLAQGFVSDNIERALISAPRGYAWNLADPLDVSPAGFFWQRAGRSLDVRLHGVLSLPAEWDAAKQAPRDINEDDLKSWTYYWQAYKQGTWRRAVGSRAAVPALAPLMATEYPVNSMKVPDQIRASVFEAELAEAEKSGQLPEIMVMGLTSDHTMGTDPKSPTPSAMMADDDLAMGRMVEAVTRSRFWPNSLVLIVEDDAQDGVDHVDGHRTVALAISPFLKRHAVDSNFYTQLSMIRTIQDIFGIAPRTRFLKAARSMNSLFVADKDLSPYQAITPGIALDEMNPPLKRLAGRRLWSARRSAAMDWNHVDDVPTQVLNRILWWDRKGYQAVMPQTRPAPRGRPGAGPNP